MWLGIIKTMLPHQAPHPSGVNRSVLCWALHQPAPILHLLPQPSQLGHHPHPKQVAPPPHPPPPLLQPPVARQAHQATPFARARHSSSMLIHATAPNMGNAPTKSPFFKACCFPRDPSFTPSFISISHLTCHQPTLFITFSCNFHQPALFIPFFCDVLRKLSNRRSW
ncbi:TPA: hypothetical protein ACH3X3_014922 [Trebouxia sp. C0006]